VKTASGRLVKLLNKGAHAYPFFFQKKGRHGCHFIWNSRTLGILSGKGPVRRPLNSSESLRMEG
jgi:hypothetical protein